MENKEDINEKFKNKLFDFEESVSPDVWKDISSELDKEPNEKRPIFWWLTFGLFFLMGSAWLVQSQIDIFKNTSVAQAEDKPMNLKGTKEVSPNSDSNPINTLNNELASSENKEKVSSSENIHQSAPGHNSKKPNDLNFDEKQPLKTTKSDQIEKRKILAKRTNQFPTPNTKFDTGAKSGIDQTQKVLAYNQAKEQPQELGQNSNKAANSSKSNFSFQVEKKSNPDQSEQSADLKISIKESTVSNKENNQFDIKESDQSPTEPTTLSKAILNNEIEKKQNFKSKELQESKGNDRKKEDLRNGIEPTSDFPIMDSVIAKNPGSLKNEEVQIPDVPPSGLTKSQKLDSDPTKLTKDSSSINNPKISRFGFGLTVSALGAFQRTAIKRETGEWNSKSLAVVKEIGSSWIFEVSACGSYALTKQLSFSANVGLNTWEENKAYETQPGLRADYNLEPVVLTNNQIRYDGLPINDQRFTQKVSSRFFCIWVQPKLDFKPIESWPIRLKPGYQLMLYNFGSTALSSPLNGPTLEVCFLFKRVEIGLKSLFYHQQNNINLVPKSTVNTFWLGGSLGWRF